MKLVRSDADPVRDKFAAARKALAGALIERDEEVDLALTALVAGEHVLLVGPPGCGIRPTPNPRRTWTRTTCSRCSTWTAGRPTRRWRPGW